MTTIRIRSLASSILFFSHGLTWHNMKLPMFIKEGSLSHDFRPCQCVRVIDFPVYIRVLPRNNTAKHTTRQLIIEFIPASDTSNLMQLRCFPDRTWSKQRAGQQLTHFSTKRLQHCQPYFQQCVVIVKLSPSPIPDTRIYSRSTTLRRLLPFIAAHNQSSQRRKRTCRNCAKSFGKSPKPL